MEETLVEGATFLIEDGVHEIKTTILTNIPIENEDFPEHILPDELAVFSNSDGNLTINTIEPDDVQEIQEIDGRYISTFYILKPPLVSNWIIF